MKRKQIENTFVIYVSLRSEKTFVVKISLLLVDLLMNSIIQQIHRRIHNIWHQHQQEIDQRDERIYDLELLVNNYENEITQLRSQLDQYQSIFSQCQAFQDVKHRQGVSAPCSSSQQCTLTIWPKSTW